MSTFIYPYKDGSKSALALSQGLECKRIKREGSRFTPRADKTVINWGSSSLPAEILRTCRVINHPDKVAAATNKLTFFQRVTELGLGDLIPRWTTSKDVARSWLAEGVKTIFARTVLTGSSGEGIVKIQNEQQLNTVREGTLLVEYILKRTEYRVHAKRSGAFIVQQKVLPRANQKEDTDFQIRNHNNGFIFIKNDINLPPAAAGNMMSMSVNLLTRLELDFAAFDIIYNSRQNKVYFLEANTAPGLEGSTIEEYVAAMKDIIDGR